MTIRDREVVELLRHDPELLAIADAVADVQRSPSRLSGSRVAGVIAVAAVALFGLVLASPWDRGSGKGFVLERALAAVADRGPVLHAVFVSPGGAVYHGPDSAPNVRVNLKDGASQLIEDRNEVWYDRERNLIRYLERRDGHLLSDDVQKGSVGVGTDPYSQFGETGLYRDALAEGKAKVVGDGSWHGHAVYWLELRLEPSEAPRPSFTFHYGVDQQTYRLLVIRQVTAEGRPTGRETGVLVFEYLPRAEGQFESTQPDAETFGPVYEADTITLAKARTAFGVPAVWLGPSLDGLSLERITLTVPCPSADCPPEGRQESKKGLLDMVYLRSSSDLQYSHPAFAPSPGPTGLKITEAPAGTARITSVFPVVSAVPPPAGFADLTYLGDIYVGNDGDGKSKGNYKRPTWAALLAVGDVWVHIDAPSRELAIAAAQALRPIPAKTD